MVVATTFASNVARLKTLAEAGLRAGRSVCLMGRAMRRMIEAAVATGVLKDFPSVISPEDVGHLPRENVMLLVTGSQGERRAASAQLANGKYQGVIGQGGLMLCRIPEETAAERNAYYGGRTQEQMTAVDQDLMKELHPSMPIHNDRRSRVTFGGRERDSE